jgi:hypothetical protein
MGAFSVSVETVDVDNIIVAGLPVSILRVI